uniref:MADS-box domain-containing protein n=1 Tax=Caenorhabditis tropicalis TaxID=1561998 RepID=A0A1I7TGC6_9PELO
MIAEKRKRKRDSEYSRKKSKNRRLNKSLFEIKKEIDSNVYDNPILYDIDSSTGIVSRMAHSSTACVDIIEDDEQELLDCLKSSGLTQSPKGMMEDLEVYESALYSMKMYPPDHKSENAQSQNHNFRHPGNLSSHLGGTASSSQSFTQQRSNNTNRPPNGNDHSAA